MHEPLNFCTATDAKAPWCLQGFRPAPALFARSGRGGMTIAGGVSDGSYKTPKILHLNFIKNRVIPASLDVANVGGYLQSAANTHQ